MQTRNIIGKTLRAKFFVSAIIPIGILLVLFYAALYFIESAKSVESEMATARQELEASAALVAFSIWNFDLEQASLMLERSLKNPRIKGLRIDFLIEPGMDVQRVYGASNPQHAERILKIPLTVTLPDNSSQPIGTLEAIVTTEGSYQALRLALLRNITFGISLILILSAGIAYALRKTVLAPLRAIQDSLDHFKRTSQRKPVAWHASDELAKFIDAYNASLAHEESLEDDLRQTSKIAERERQRAQRYLDTVQTTMVALDRDGNISMINRAGCALLGFEESELLGRSWFEKCLPQPEGMEKVYPVFQRIISGDLESAEYFENTVCCKDGSDRICAWHNACLHDDEGQIIGTLSSGEDVTERKRAELAKQADEEMFRAFYELNLVGLAIISPEKGWIQINDCLCKMLEYSEQELRNMTWAQLTHPEDLAADVEQFNRMLAREIEGYSLDKRFISRTGRLVYTQLVVRCVRKNNGDVDYVVAMVEDITARKRMEDDLVLARDTAETANRTKSIFLANMSHELRTPLNAVLGFSDILRRDPALTESQLQNLEIIHKSGNHLLGLINDVLDIAKIEAGRIVLDPRPFDLGNMIRDVTDMLRIRAENKGLQLLLDESSEFPHSIVGDQAKLRQIFVNLISNAINATEQGGVTLRLGLKHNHAEHLIIEVEDTGCGISAEDQARLFQPFVQVGGLQNKQKGTGLGLAITKQFAELMGGSITLSSSVGQGSTFRVEVLVQLAQPQDIPQAPQARGEVTGLEPGQPAYRVLVVDDQEENWPFLTRLLGSVGFEVEHAENGAEAVEIFRKWRPHFIWMDRRMPVMDGLEATCRIRALPGGDKVKIAAVTASTFSEEDAQLTAAGFDDIVHKPFRAEQIFDCMEKLLGVRFLRADTEVAKITAPAMDVEQARPLVAALPEQLRNELEHAATVLDMEEAYAVIEAICTVEPGLADILKGCVEAMDFSAIRRMIDYE